MSTVFKYQDFELPEPLLSCHILKYVRGPSASSVLIIKLQTEPDLKDFVLLVIKKHYNINNKLKII